MIDVFPPCFSLRHVVERLLMRHFLLLLLTRCCRWCRYLRWHWLFHFLHYAFFHWYFFSTLYFADFSLIIAAIIIFWCFDADDDAIFAILFITPFRWYAADYFAYFRRFLYWWWHTPFLDAAAYFFLSPAADTPLYWYCWCFSDYYFSPIIFFAYLIIILPLSFFISFLFNYADWCFRCRCRFIFLSRDDIDYLFDYAIAAAAADYFLLMLSFADIADAFFRRYAPILRRAFLLFFLLPLFRAEFDAFAFFFATAAAAASRGIFARLPPALPSAEIFFWLISFPPAIATWFIYYFHYADADFSFRHFRCHWYFDAFLPMPYAATTWHVYLMP